MLKEQCQKFLINRKCPKRLMFLQGEQGDTEIQRYTKGGIIAISPRGTAEEAAGADQCN